MNAPLYLYLHMYLSLSLCVSFQDFYWDFFQAMAIWSVRNFSSFLFEILDIFNFCNLQILLLKHPVLKTNSLYIIYIVCLHICSILYYIHSICKYFSASMYQDLLQVSYTVGSIFSPISGYWKKKVNMMRLIFEELQLDFIVLSYFQIFYDRHGQDCN